eukprot:GHVQ01029304.1.p2 GENE.GHVQ01029304.1~~GHVQ01029304.1.p2  ORF type:complete len:133 (-),score=14.85 GHVQ01029304.1:1022-1420(-)
MSQRCSDLLATAPSASCGVSPCPELHSDWTLHRGELADNDDHHQQLEQYLNKRYVQCRMSVELGTRCDVLNKVPWPDFRGLYCMCNVEFCQDKNVFHTQPAPARYNTRPDGGTQKKFITFAAGQKQQPTEKI